MKCSVDAFDSIPIAWTSGRAEKLFGSKRALRVINEIEETSHELGGCRGSWFLREYAPCFLPLKELQMKFLRVTAIEIIMKCLAWDVGLQYCAKASAAK